MSDTINKDWAKIPEDWEFSVKQREAIAQLAAYGTHIRGDSDSDKSGRLRKRLTILIPFKLDPEKYVEVGYLASQIARDDFPTHYSRFGFTTDCWQGVKDPTIRFKDVTPSGYRLSVQLD